MSERPLVSLAEAIIDRLERSGLDHALGGALALAYGAEPRATRDIDLTIYVSPDELMTGLDVLVAAGLEPPPASAAEDARDRGLVVMRGDDIRVDVLIPSEPFDLYLSARARRRRVRFGERQTWTLSAEFSPSSGCSSIATRTTPTYAAWGPTRPGPSTRTTCVGGWCSSSDRPSIASTPSRGSAAPPPMPP